MSVCNWRVMAVIRTAAASVAISTPASPEGCSATCKLSGETPYCIPSSPDDYCEILSPLVCES
jgi:hypothetical protein